MPYVDRKRKIKNNIKWRKTKKGKLWYRKWIKEWRLKHPDEWKPRYYKNKYGLTLEQIEQMKLVQNYKCYICNKEKKLVVDHCHVTNKVRHLLCIQCNVRLGWYESNMEKINEFIIY